MSVQIQPVFVAGGAGFIGSAMTHFLTQRGYNCIVYDKAKLPKHLLNSRQVIFIQADLNQTEQLQNVFQQYRPHAVFNFAGLIQVNESIVKPELYYQNNFCTMLPLLDAALSVGTKYFIFSSSAAVYGEPHSTPIKETHSKLPLNPYGHSKQFVEILLSDFRHAYGLSSASLRYFNASGAHPQGLYGENHEPETHLIPLILQVASGKRPFIEIFGDDYPTPDGTCLRDYVHIEDLCHAHFSALQYLQHQPPQAISINLGSGRIYSVKSVIDACQDITQHPIATQMKPRRTGDAAILQADITLAQNLLEWQPQFSAIENIITDAWHWQKLLDKKQEQQKIEQ